MIVKCVKLVNAVTGESERTNNWLTIGKEYTVLEVFVSPDHQTTLRCQSDDNLTPIMDNANQFVTVDDRIPSNWVVELGSEGIMELAPRTWLRKGFWEEYFDGDIAAIRDYENELAKILIDA